MEKNKGKFSSLIQIIRGSRVLLLIVSAAAAVAALILYFSFRTYVNYQQELILKEQQQLLTMAETVGKSLVNYVEEELESLDLYFAALEGQTENADFLQSASETLLDEKNALYDAVACYDEAGTLIFEKGIMDFDVSLIPDAAQAVICGKQMCSGGWYEMFLSRKYRYGNDILTFIYAMNLNELYLRVVKPVQIGDGGYSIVKDRDLAIIMHHASSQIGIDAIYDRQELYPQLDLTDLFRWIDMQRVQEEGYDVIDTYIWDDPSLSPQRRIVAYTTIHLPGEDWIVNSTLPYEELAGPLKWMIIRLFFISGLALLFLAVLIYTITRSHMLTENQKKEIDYLREINEGMELLRRKEEEIQHYQRIQSIGEMSSHIAHEFNNYLTPVMVYGEILKEDETLSDENRELVGSLLNSVEQAAGLSRKLLDFSRQDSAGVLTTIDLTDEVKNALDMIGHLVPQKVTLRTEVPDAPLFIRGRAQMAKHLLMNLCNNAFHAMEKEGGSLSVALKDLPNGSFDEPGDWILLSVSDTGCGISKDALDKIFEPFYTTKRSGKGTGLGLSVVRSTVTAVGGEIRVESEPGKGTAFYLYFPKSAESDASQSRRHSTRPRKVLVVDDDPDILKTMGALLKSMNCKYECYNHPAAVLSKLQNKKDVCDVLITDYSMPSMNGLELAEIIRKLNPDIRLILISGMTDDRFDWYLKNKFIDAFILKTEINQETLAAVLA